MPTRALIILKMKADNDLAINLPVLFESVKNENNYVKKNYDKIKKTKAKRPKKGRKFVWWELNPRPLTCKVIVMSIAPRHQMLHSCDKLIIFNVFAHEI